MSRNVTFHEKIGKAVINNGILQDNDDEEVLLLIEKEEEEIPQQEAREKDQGNNKNEQQDIEEATDNEGVEEDVKVRQIQESPHILRNRQRLKCPSRYEAGIAEYVIPSTYKEAVKGTEATQWAKAIEEELKAHEENHTWTLVPRRANQKTIDSKWVFTVKIDTEDKTHRFKARLCARGF